MAWDLQDLPIVGHMQMYLTYCKNHANTAFISRKAEVGTKSVIVITLRYFSALLHNALTLQHRGEKLSLLLIIPLVSEKSLSLLTVIVLA